MLNVAHKVLYGVIIQYFHNFLKFTSSIMSVVEVDCNRLCYNGLDFNENTVITNKNNSPKC